MKDSEWAGILDQMDRNEEHLRTLGPEEPGPRSARCSESLHRTLGHLRACQETWLEACLAMARTENPSLKLLHPWRIFEQRSYHLEPWDDHLRTFLSDRAKWKGLLEETERSRMGKVNGTAHSIESLTRRLVLHEAQHLFPKK